MIDKPFFSIVYPTKNRHFLIKYCIESILLQDFIDFELIIYDNSTDFLTKDIVNNYLFDKRIKYFKNETTIPMSENWELALSKTTGEYISVLTDKTILYTDTLNKVYSFLKANDCEVLNWRDNTYFLVDENVEAKKGYDRGIHIIKYLNTKPKKIDLQKELKRNFSQKYRRGNEMEKYFWGKICFGVYKRELIDRILDNEDSLFTGISPDYSSKIKALCYSKSIIDIGESLQLTFDTKISNGGNNSISATMAKSFIESYNNKNYFKNLPIPFLYSSSHNVVAFDFWSTKKAKSFQLNKRNFLLRIKEDLFLIQYKSKNEREKQYELFKNEFDKLSMKVKLRINLSFIKFVIINHYSNLKLFFGRVIKRKPVGKINKSIVELIKELQQVKH